MPTILLVEDTETVRKMYQFGLEQSGFTVTSVGSGGEALARVEEQHFDIILLDMMLTGMSGLDFLNQYDIKTKSPGTKVVVISNVDNPDIINRAQSYGIDGYLVKAQVEPQDLVSYLRQLLGESTGTTPPAPTAPTA